MIPALERPLILARSATVGSLPVEAPRPWTLLPAPQENILTGPRPARLRTCAGLVLAGAKSIGSTRSPGLATCPRLVVPPRPGRRRRARPFPRPDLYHRDLAPLHLTRLQHRDPPRRRRRRPRRCRGAEKWQSRRIAALRKPVESLQVAAAVRRRRLPVRGQEDPQFRQEVLLDLRRLGVDPWLRFVLRLPRRRCVRILRQDLFAGRRIDPETDRPPEDDLAAADRPRIRQEATSRRQIARESVRRRPRGGR